MFHILQQYLYYCYTLNTISNVSDTMFLLLNSLFTKGIYLYYVYNIL